MLKRIGLSFGLLLLTVTAGAAKELPKQRAQEETSPRKDTACSYLGEGYVRAPGSDTCIRVSGSVRAEESVIFGH